MNRQERRRQIADLTRQDEAMRASFPADMRAATDLHRRGRLKEAADAYRKIAKVYADHPDVRVAWSNLGATLQGLGRLDDAIAALKKARSLKPDHPPPHHNLGMALAQQGKLDEAIESLTRAVTLEPGFRDAWVGLALTHERKGDWPLAVQAYEKAIAADPKALEPRYSLGSLLARFGQLAAAIARILQAEGKQDGAADYYFAAAAVAPDATAIQGHIAALILAIAAQGQEGRAKATALLERWQAAHPGQPLTEETRCRLQDQPASA
jgi:tetratricopeptide (TPR) repeat protein